MYELQDARKTYHRSLQELGIEAIVEKVEDSQKITSCGNLSTPGLSHRRKGRLLRFGSYGRETEKDSSRHRAHNMERPLGKTPRLDTALLLPAWVLLYAALQPFANFIIQLSGLAPGDRLTEAARFFVFEVPKVLCS